MKHFLLKTLQGLIEITHLDPTIRGCRFSWESDTLTYYSRWSCVSNVMKTRSFQRYSHTSCRMECALEKALSASHCLPWYSTTHFEFQALDFRHYKTNNEIANFQRYLPHPPKADIKTCRSSTPLISISQASSYPSSNETHWFLKTMSSVSESECACLPDCQFTDFQFSHTSANLM